MARAIPTSKEAPFELHELFFSTTNPRGVIESGNQVFVRVSGYSTEKLMGSPHSIIRHPDMPRCVFKLFWSHLQEQQPIGAYVKNMAQDGSYYWVYAVAFPTSTGFLSLRLKPSSPLFSRVQNLYAEILNFEEENDMDRALMELLRRIRDLGFANYESFMTFALVEEMKSRDRTVLDHLSSAGSSNHPFLAKGLDMAHRCQAEYRAIFESLIKLLKNGSSLKNCAESILSCFTDLTFLSINMAVGAAKLGSDGKAIAEVSNGFRMMAEEIQTRIQQFDRKLQSVLSGIEGSQFQIGSSRLQVETMQSFLKEAASSWAQEGKFDDKEFVKNLKLLAALCGDSSRHVDSSLTHLVKTLSELLVVSEDLISILNGLEVIRLTGKVEAARLAQQHKEAFGNHIQQMTEFVEKVADQMKIVRRLGKDCSEELRDCLSRLARTTQKITLMSEKELSKSVLS